MEWMILPLKRYFDFKGRSRRKEFWMYTLFVFIVTIVLTILDDVLGLGGSVSGETDYSDAGAAMAGSMSGGWLSNIFAIATFIPGLAVSVRRLHDLNRTGWWVVLPIVLLLVGAITFGVSAAAAMEDGGTGLGGTSVVAMVLLAAGAISALLLFVWYVMPGTQGPNRFGEDPKGEGADVEEVFG